MFISRELSAPFQKISWDIVGKLPKSPDQNVFLLTMIDQFTRWPEAVPLPDKSAHSIAKALFSTWISRYGVISQLHGDNSLENRSELTKQVCLRLGVFQTFSPIYRPNSNRCERFHRTLFETI